MYLISVSHASPNLYGTGDTYTTIKKLIEVFSDLDLVGGQRFQSILDESGSWGNVHLGFRDSGNPLKPEEKEELEAFAKEYCTRVEIYRLEEV